MYARIIYNDIARNTVVTTITMLFIAAAALLVALAAVLIINLSGAMETLMREAQTPHFMQMHAGPIDPAGIDSFAQQQPDVLEYQILEFLNIESAQIVIGSNSLASNVQDNGFSVQSEHFDYLLDLDNQIITVSDGQVYVPLCYLKDQTAAIGDELVVKGMSFTVAGFLRDSQMNSNLSSSKRFLISANDYEKLQEFGEIEYLIEFRLHDLSRLSAFESAYIEAGLEANGPTITYPLFKMINALSDGFMIAVILLVSLLIVAIAFMCIRFTLLAKIEDDYREIGIMKAIGLQLNDIKKIYLMSYALIAVTGSLLGLALSYVFKGLLLENIRLFMGESDNTALAPLLSLLGVLLIGAAVMIYVYRILHRFRSISAVEAIRYGGSQKRPHLHSRLSLNQNNLVPVNVFLGIKDVLSRKSLYATMLAVLIIAACIIIFPQNLYNTISSKDFISYMGVGSYDLRFDIQQTDSIPEKASLIAQALSADPEVTASAVYTTKVYTLITDEGSREQITVELGDHSVFPISYAQGSGVSSEDEIALSSINARELGTQVGDTLTLLLNGSPRVLTVSGIYSDITNGGKTAKASFSDPSARTMWAVISAALDDPSLAEEKTRGYAELFGYAKVSGVDAYIDQTFGSTIESVRKAAGAAAAVALAVSVLVTLLFMKMLIARDRYPIAVMKALGFTSADIRVQYISRSVFVLLIGVVLGTVAANTLGEVLAGKVIAAFGAASFSFTIDPFTAYLISPLMMAAAVLAATGIGVSRAGHITMIDHIKE
ncbi:MAG: ABC transporter permease [Spirochaetia bacterium]|nr:ABC transporter permease [Spirochaetia bacterium]MCF7941496.1 ABC transporter permease [Spirochaetia bacterium]